VDGQGPVLGADGAEAATSGAGLWVGQALGLLLEEDLQGTVAEAIGGGVCDLLHGSQIEGEVRSIVSEGTSCDDFSPAGDQFVDLPEFFGCDVALRHLQSLPVLASSTEGSFLLSLYQNRLCLAKGVLASPCWFRRWWP
jgi:hypothetical protein